MLLLLVHVEIDVPVDFVLDVFRPVVRRALEMRHTYNGREWLHLNGNEALRLNSGDSEWTWAESNRRPVAEWNFRDTTMPLSPVAG